MIATKARLSCFVCDRTPSEIPEYVIMARDEEMDPDDYVREEEGTF